jgi:hypothetical protein
MLRVLGFERLNDNGTTLLVESDEFMPDQPDLDIRYLLGDGILETYLHHYGFPAGASLTALLLDAFYEDIEMPHWETDHEEEFKRIVALGPERIEWHCDKNELLAAVTLDEDNAGSVAGTWVALREEYANRAAAFQKTQEEQLAAEFVDSMPVEIRTQPRNPNPAMPETSVGLAINFVP